MLAFPTMNHSIRQTVESTVSGRVLLCFWYPVSGNLRLMAVVMKKGLCKPQVMTNFRLPWQPLTAIPAKLLPRLLSCDYQLNRARSSFEPSNKLARYTSKVWFGVSGHPLCHWFTFPGKRSSQCGVQRHVSKLFQLPNPFTAIGSVVLNMRPPRIRNLTELDTTQPSGQYLEHFSVAVGESGSGRHGASLGAKSGTVAAHSSGTWRRLVWVRNVTEVKRRGNFKDAEFGR